MQATLLAMCMVIAKSPVRVQFVVLNKLNCSKVPHSGYMWCIEGTHMKSCGVLPSWVRCMTVKTVASIDLIGMLRTDCSGETRLALHVPSSS